MTTEDSNSTANNEQSADFAKLMNERAQQEQEQMGAAFEEASTKLTSMMEKDSDLQHLGYMILLGYRFIQWAASKSSEYEGMSTLMLEILINAQERKSQDPFDFIELVEDFEKRQMPWLESQRKDSLMRRSARERRLKEFARKLRRKDIELPFHSMTAACGEGAFTHEKSLYLIGPSEALRVVLRYCLKEYQRAGGTAALLSTAAVEANEATAKITLPIGEWSNCANIYADTLKALDPVARGFPNRQIGLLGVDNLRSAFHHATPPIEEGQRIMFAANVFHQYQIERGLAMLVGISTDDVPEGIDPMELLPWVKDRPHVRVAIEDSKLVDGSRNVVIGNDVIVYSQLLERLKD